MLKIIIIADIHTEMSKCIVVTVIIATVLNYHSNIQQLNDLVRRKIVSQAGRLLVRMASHSPRHLVGMSHRAAAAAADDVDERTDDDASGRATAAR